MNEIPLKIEVWLRPKPRLTQMNVCKLNAKICLFNIQIRWRGSARATIDLNFHLQFSIFSRASINRCWNEGCNKQTNRTKIYIYNNINNRLNSSGKTIFFFWETQQQIQRSNQPNRKLQKPSFYEMSIHLSCPVDFRRWVTSCTAFKLNRWTFRYINTSWRCDIIDFWWYCNEKINLMPFNAIRFFTSQTVQRNKKQTTK